MYIYISIRNINIIYIYTRNINIIYNDIYFLYIYLFIPSYCPPNGGWPTTKQINALTPFIPSIPSSHQA